MKDKKQMTRKKRVRKYLTNVGLAALTIVFASGPVRADEANKALGTEGGKQVLNEALKTARTKPALSLAAAITCLACLPAAGAAASPALCVACGILIAKVLG